MKSCEFEAYENLSAAVVELAIKDYKHALKQIHRHPNDTRAMMVIGDCERFFKDEIKIYTDLDGIEIMRRVRVMAFKELTESEQRKTKKLQEK